MATSTLSYRLVRRVAEGGAGELFYAVQPDGQPLAVKCSHLDSSVDPEGAAALLREFELAATLDHPNVVSHRGAQRDGNRVHLLLEWVHGIDLARLRRHSPGLPADAANYIVTQVLSALHYAHTRARLIHRDVSPHNVLIGLDGAVKLTDFGIAKLMGGPVTHGRVVHGKLAYMSPEQQQALDLDARSDLFAVGVLLYELLTDQKPYGDADTEIIAALANPRPLTPAIDLAPDIPAKLSEVATQLLHCERARRPRSALAALEALPPCPDGAARLRVILRELEAAGALDDLAELRQLTAAELRRTGTARPRRGRRVAYLVSAGMAAAAAGSVWLWTAGRERTPRTRARRRGRPSSRYQESRFRSTPSVLRRRISPALQRPQTRPRNRPAPTAEHRQPGVRSWTR